MFLATRSRRTPNAEGAAPASARLPRTAGAPVPKELGIGTRPKSCTLEGSCLSIPLLFCQVVSAMRAELRRALTTRHRPVHNHARAKVAPACARPSRCPPAQKMHAGKKDVKHTLLFILGASGDEESPISRRSPEALWRGAGVRPPPRPRTPSEREVCLHDITRSNHDGAARTRGPSARF